jgi:hypothetical protein
LFFSAFTHRPGAAVLVVEHIRPSQDQRLPRVVGRHLDSPPFESPLDTGENFVIQHELAVQNARHHFLGDIVFCRSESADRNQQRSALERTVNRPFEIVFVIADNRLHHDWNADEVELLGEIDGIRIDEIRRQQLRADGDDFGRYHV